MCFTQKHSLFFWILGTGLAAYLKQLGTPLYAWLPVLYFSSMEFLQYLQYFYIDNCEHHVNKALTLLAYVHIAFQGVFINLWYSYFMSESERSAFLKWVIPLSLIAGILMIITRFEWLLPKLGNYATEKCDGEYMCGKDICSYYGGKHVAWRFPLVREGDNYFTPGISLHFFLFFIPILTVAKGKYFLLPLVLLLLGPYLSYRISPHKNEHPAIWCLMFVSHLFITLLKAHKLV